MIGRIERGINYRHQHSNWLRRCLVLPRARCDGFRQHPNILVSKLIYNGGYLFKIDVRRLYQHVSVGWLHNVSASWILSPLSSGLTFLLHIKLMRTHGSVHIIVMKQTCYTNKPTYLKKCRKQNTVHRKKSKTINTRLLILEKTLANRRSFRNVV